MATVSPCVVVWPTTSSFISSLFFPLQRNYCQRTKWTAAASYALVTTVASGSLLLQGCLLGEMCVYVCGGSHTFNRWKMSEWLCGAPNHYLLRGVPLLDRISITFMPDQRQRVCCNRSCVFPPRVCKLGLRSLVTTSRGQQPRAGHSCWTLTTLCKNVAAAEGSNCCFDSWYGGHA